MAKQVSGLNAAVALGFYPDSPELSPRLILSQRSVYVEAQTLRTEYERELVELVRRSRSSCQQIALEVGINPKLLTPWVREDDAGAGKVFPGGGTPRDEELARLKRDLSKVTRERDF